ncbi:hypothetical protein NA57DRAFT_73333 [Rhizodiscina lignyota]|uniref:Uncharacterized protein n=1 Tax=Rhizodiscina lignyota TaxID=1504668 RepID=A0A9P4IMD8_9PEZI|nr:hypothetical protein NA57DRAFT_73333 [Rhizodiscina lignyota]
MRSQLLTFLSSCLLTGGPFVLASPADIFQCNGGVCTSLCNALAPYPIMLEFPVEAAAFCRRFLSPYRSTRTHTTTRSTRSRSVRPVTKTSIARSTQTDLTTRTITDTTTTTTTQDFTSTTTTVTTSNITISGTAAGTGVMGKRQFYPFDFSNFANNVLSSACGCFGAKPTTATIDVSVDAGVKLRRAVPVTTIGFEKRQVPAVTTTAVPTEAPPAPVVSSVATETSQAPVVSSVDIAAPQAPAVSSVEITTSQAPAVSSVDIATPEAPAVPTVDTATTQAPAVTSKTTFEVQKRQGPRRSTVATTVIFRNTTITSTTFTTTSTTSTTTFDTTFIDTATLTTTQNVTVLCLENGSACNINDPSACCSGMCAMIGNAAPTCQDM